MRPFAVGVGLLLTAVAALGQATSSTISPGAFGARSWRENGLAPGALPLTGNTAFDVRLATDGHLYYWSGSAWVDLTTQGPQGDPGADGADGAPGAQGPAGAAATVSVGSTTTGAPGSSASVTNSGTSSAAVLEFTIPRGDVGATGATGAAGATGATGAAGADGIPRTIQDEGSDLIQRLNVNFVGTGVGCVDDPGSSRTTCTVPGGLTNPLAAGSVGTNALQVVQAGTGLWQPAANVLGLAANGIEALRLNTAAAGVNYVEITPQATGGGGSNGPTIKSSGSDGNVDLNFDVKGTSARYQWKINGTTRMDFTDIGSGFALRNNTGPIQVPNGKYVGSDSNNSVLFANGGNWTEIKGNGVVGLRVDSTATYLYTKTVTAASALTIADNGDGGTRATATITPTTSFVTCSVADPQGADIALSETGAVAGQRLTIVNVGANVCGFSDTTGVTELAGAADLGPWDTLELLYAVDRFVEISRVDN